MVAIRFVKMTTSGSRSCPNDRFANVRTADLCFALSPVVSARKNFDVEMDWLTPKKELLSRPSKFTISSAVKTTIPVLKFAVTFMKAGGDVSNVTDVDDAIATGLDARSWYETASVYIEPSTREVDDGMISNISVCALSALTRSSIVTLYVPMISNELENVTNGAIIQVYKAHTISV